MSSYINIILPAILTVIGNILFYTIIKRRIDDSIEKSKISYSGTFKEKIDIYKKLLEQVHDLKVELSHFQNTGSDDLKRQLMDKFNSLMRFYTVNSPFISSSLLMLFQEITHELMDIYENFIFGDIRQYGRMSPEIMEERDRKYWQAVSRLREDKKLKILEERIIIEMREELHTK